jgi:hypothetical protein
MSEKLSKEIEITEKNGNLWNEKFNKSNKKIQWKAHQ